MSPESNLQTLLATMNPILDDRRFVFVTVDDDTGIDIKHSAILCLFKETELITLIVEKNFADSQRWVYGGVWRKITMMVHSDLETVGFLAVLCEHLAAAHISVNAISAYYHDHCFVLEKDADKAMEVLEGLSVIT